VNEIGIIQKGASEAVKSISEGEITSEEFVSACLEQIDANEERIGAWTHLNREYALIQAREADLARGEGKNLGPLHGVPVGIKDIIDTADMPTADGTPLHAGRQPAADASVVQLLREAGAIFLGKTVTTEMACYAPGKTANPHDTARTPGGSSSGSAAAVASYMVPLAVGTQTNGSVIRPASYCGVHGFKPSHGFVSRHGLLSLSRFLDQVGMFARSVEDLALIGDVLMGYDDLDPDMRVRSRSNLVETAMAEPPVSPRLGFIRTPVWDQADDDVKGGFEELVEHLGEDAEEIALPGNFDSVVDLHQTVMEADIARNFHDDYERGKEKISPVLREMIERGQKVLAVDYTRAIDQRLYLNGLLGQIFDVFDAIITPAATGEAPIGLESTGSPIFCTIWTFCGVPAVTIPLLEGSNGLPIGVQLIGPKGDDARLLRTARWLEGAVSE
jgi:Asp-tRNA(Asn)/Glu-tRNA(Gln) amidotransferase A subunit family amidase